MEFPIGRVPPILPPSAPVARPPSHPTRHPCVWTPLATAASASPAVWWKCPCTVDQIWGTVCTLRAFRFEVLVQAAVFFAEEALVSTNISPSLELCASVSDWSISLGKRSGPIFVESTAFVLLFSEIITRGSFLIPRYCLFFSVSDPPS